MQGIELIKGEERITGLIESGVVSLNLTVVSSNEKEEIFLNLSGRNATTNERLVWKEEELKIGDDFVVKIVDNGESSTPIKIDSSAPDDLILQGKLRAYSALKKELEQAGLI
ncbi:hypothetical protein [Algoriphagus mannitolivorans]|uniref:hypothetical protein n=1 Tax=Algoriphagus mannitolivorans TaxID=226504 RepID=UPI0003F4B424|nr:hypothetical protein [Algoriphagus mannitolivorans]